MADSGISHFYLQLHDSVEGDPRLTSLPPSVYALFVRLRQMSLKGDCPGEINLSWEDTLRCLGVRSEKRMAYLEALLITQRRLLSRGSKEGQDGQDGQDGQEFVMIARWTMPQLARVERRQETRDTATPRPRYASDSPEARRRQRAQEREEQEVPSLAQSFFNAPDGRAESVVESDAESAQTPPQQSGVPYSIEEKSKQSKADSATPPPVRSAEEIAAALLMVEGIDAPTSERLVKAGATESIIAAAIETVNERKVTTNRAGMLRRAVEAALSGTPYLPPNRHKAASPARHKTTHRSAKPQPGENPDMALLRRYQHPNAPGASASPPAS